MCAISNYYNGNIVHMITVTLCVIKHSENKIVTNIKEKRKEVAPGMLQPSVNKHRSARISDKKNKIETQSSSANVLGLSHSCTQHVC